MCGIAGILRFKPTVSLENGIECMTSALRHRGPDANGQWIEHDLALGHSRLSILDLSAAANQPMLDADGRYVMVYNGEVYNFKDLKRELGSYPFRTNSDSEVLLAAYREWGPKAIERFNGIFALAIWDRQERSLFLSRDRMGVKPLYYHQSGDAFVFASEIRALLASTLVPRELDQNSLQDYLRFYSVNTPKTLVKNVYQLRAGHNLIHCNGSFTEKRHWFFTDALSGEQKNNTLNSVQSDVHFLLKQAVHRQLVSDVPLAAFLSGGIDSSAMVALMAETGTTAPNTFTVGFEDPAFDESPFAQMVAERHNTRHHRILLKPEDFLKELPDALSAMDHPSGDGLNSYVVSKAIKQQGFTVAISGLGGDELFGGYPQFRRYAMMRKYAFLARVPQPIRKTLGSLAYRLKPSCQTERLSGMLSARAYDFKNLYPLFRMIAGNNSVEALLPASGTNYDSWAGILTEQDLSYIETLPFYAQITAGELLQYTQNVLLRDTDQMSMAHALEVRVPFFDHELVNYMLQLPDHFKQQAYPKKLLVDSLGALLPSEIVHRPKMGFVFPWDSWMRTDLRDFCTTAIELLERNQIFRAGVCSNKWADFHKNQVSWIEIWPLVVLSSWLSKNIC